MRKEDRQFTLDMSKVELFPCVDMQTSSSPISSSSESLDAAAAALRICCCWRINCGLRGGRPGPRPVPLPLPRPRPTGVADTGETTAVLAPLNGDDKGVLEADDGLAPPFIISPGVTTR